MDDITVIVAHVVKEQKSPDEAIVEMRSEPVPQMQDVDGETSVQRRDDEEQLIPDGLSEGWA